jgi:hypothetical protein
VYPLWEAIVSWRRCTSKLCSLRNKRTFMVELCNPGHGLCAQCPALKHLPHHIGRYLRLQEHEHLGLDEWEPERFDGADLYDVWSTYIQQPTSSSNFQAGSGLGHLQFFSCMEVQHDTIPGNNAACVYCAMDHLYTCMVCISIRMDCI